MIMKTVRYLCDCGAVNKIPLQARLRGSTPTFFYCSDCGKPSYDICKQCDNRTPSGSRHRFCQLCGAEGEAIQAGTAVIDMARNLRECLFGIPFTASLIWLSLHGTDYFPKKLSPGFLGSMLAILGIALLLGYLCPIYTLLTGERQAPLTWRALSCYGYFFTEYDDPTMIRRALKFRTRIKAMQRWFQAQKRKLRKP